MKKIDQIKQDYANWEARKKQLDSQKPDDFYASSKLHGSKALKGCYISTMKYIDANQLKLYLIQAGNGISLSMEDAEELYLFLKEFFEDDDRYTIATSQINVMNPSELYKDEGEANNE